MRLSYTFAATILLQIVFAQEQSWGWSQDNSKLTGETSQQIPDNIAAADSYNEDVVQLNNTEIEKVVDDILTSTRQGRALDGYDEVYSDPNVQEALQDGDDSKARNLIKDRLCFLGLMQCDEQIQGKRPYISPEELVYAQPVAINPVGKPIPTIPLKGVKTGPAYGPPRPISPYPNRPPSKFGPPPSKFGPPPSFSANKPPRRGYGPPPNKQFLRPGGTKPFLNGEIYEGGEFSHSHQGGVILGDHDIPYQFDQGGQHQKDKKVEVVVNAHGGSVTGTGSSTAAGGVLEHVHHHYHHNLDGTKSPTVVVNPVPVAAVAGAVSGSHSSSQNNFFKPSQGYGGLTIGGGGLGSSYGGQTIANYGSSSFGVKPVQENYGPQSFNSFGTSVGSYGTTGLYKKELNLNSVSSNYLQSSYAEKYQGLESARAENYDCICVPYDQCPSHDIIGRKDDLYLPLDPRNLKSDIEAEEEERVITDGNGTMTVVRVPKDASLNTTKLDEEKKKISKREVPTTTEKAKVEARQAYYGNSIGRPTTCGPRHVCCKRPLRPNVPTVNRQCGTRHSQGINGRIKNPVYVDGDSEFGEYPWQVAILKKDPKESVYVCGGTLIDPLHIITAAHCVKTYTGFDLRVRLGEWDVNHDVEFYPYIERDIVSVNVHPEFYAGTLYNDLAILRMDKPVDFSKHPHISPACLPHPQDDYTGSRCWTTGWGKDAFGDFGKYQNILKEVDVPVVNFAQCQRQLQQTRLGYDFKLHPGFVCAGGEEGKDACKGDGGGPMVCERGGTWQVVGVVSWGIGCGQAGVPGVYVKVAHYIDWIRQVTQLY